MEVLTPQEAVKTARVSLRTLQYAVSKGELKILKIGRSVRFDKADLVAWLQSKKMRRDNGGE
jgi:excisionase family DNA binding protein